jgi:hypothetical protein
VAYGRLFINFNSVDLRDVSRPVNWGPYKSFIAHVGSSLGLLVVGPNEPSYTAPHQSSYFYGILSRISPLAFYKVVDY